MMAKNKMNMDTGLSRQEGFAFDMSFSTLARVNYHLMLGNTASTMRSAEGLLAWLHNLSVVDREISPLLIDNKLINREDELVLDKARLGAESVSTAVNNRRASVDHGLLVSYLDAYERVLRGLFHKLKLYMKEVEDPMSHMFH